MVLDGKTRATSALSPGPSGRLHEITLPFVAVQNPGYLTMLDRTFGPRVVQHVTDMCAHNVRRRHHDLAAAPAAKPAAPNASPAAVEDHFTGVERVVAVAADDGVATRAARDVLNVGNRAEARRRPGQEVNVHSVGRRVV